MALPHGRGAAAAAGGDGLRLKWMPICDEFSWELVALEVERRMEAKDVIRILNAAVHARRSRAGLRLAR